MLLNTMDKFKILIVSLFLFGSCSEYEKILKSDDIELKYEKAFEYYGEGEYVKASTLFEYLIPIYKATDKSARLEYHHAKSLYYQADYILAGYHFGEFAENYGQSEYLEEAEFMHAYCYYMLSPRFSLDQANTYKAINAFRMFMLKNPRSPKIGESKEIITELTNKLAKKSFHSAKLYFDLGDYKAAIIALKNSLEDYPESDYREKSLFLILKASYLLADNSVPSKRVERFQSTADEYLTFLDEYPDSEYIDEAEKYYDASMKILNN